MFICKAHTSVTAVAYAKLATALNLYWPIIFITYNQVLSTTAKRRDLLANPGRSWSLRLILADFLVTTANILHFIIIKIGRDTNRVARKKARQDSILSSCLFSRESWTHSENCTIHMSFMVAIFFCLLYVFNL